MEANVSLPHIPHGWKLVEEKGRMVYVTSDPVVRIHSVAMLKEYQKKGRYVSVEAENLVFSRKKLKTVHQPQSSPLSNGVTSSCSEPMDIQGSFADPEKVSEKSKLEKEKEKLEKEKEKVMFAVKNLTIDPNKKVNHRERLCDTARKLNFARLSRKLNEENFDFETLKSVLSEAQDENDMSRILWDIPFFRTKFSTLINSKYLEQLLNLASVSESPLLKFPPDVNKNTYSEIIELALTNAPDFLLLVINLAVKHENPLTEKDVIKIAFLFSQFAGCVNSKNNVMKKIKSITLKCNGLTNDGLDCMATLGAAETSRSFRNDRDFMASISDEILKSYAKTMMAQFTFDNLDLQINHNPHHLTLNFLEFEQTNTSELSTSDSKSFEEMKNLFGLETVLMQSDQNKLLFDHYKERVAGTLGRLFGKEIPKVKWMLDVFPKHYSHPNSGTASRKSLTHVDKPMYLQETKNR